MSTPFIIFLSVTSIVIVLCSVVVLVAFIRSRQFANKVASSPAPPFKCPACGGEQIDILLSSLWDGVDAVGRRTGGVRTVGTCKTCGVHAEYASYWDHDKKETCYEIRKSTDEEWRREIERQ